MQFSMRLLPELEDFPEAFLHWLTPERLINICAAQKKRFPSTIGLAYTCNEPTVWYEFVKIVLNNRANGCEPTCYKRIHRKGSVGAASPLIDANIDVKAWDEQFYRSLAGKLNLCAGLLGKRRCRSMGGGCLSGDTRGERRR